MLQLIQLELIIGGVGKDLSRKQMLNNFYFVTFCKTKTINNVFFSFLYIVLKNGVW